MTGRSEAINSIRKALAMLNERMQRNAGYGVYIHAKEQLGRMLVELGHPYLAPTPKRDWVDVGLMAAKELEAHDIELACALMDADYDFNHTR